MLFLCYFFFARRHLILSRVSGEPPSHPSRHHILPSVLHRGRARPILFQSLGTTPLRRDRYHQPGIFDFSLSRRPRGRWGGNPSPPASEPPTPPPRLAATGRRRRAKPGRWRRRGLPFLPRMEAAARAVAAMAGSELGEGRAGAASAAR
jgi:hypothetical protein